MRILGVFVLLAVTSLGIYMPMAYADATESGASAVETIVDTVVDEVTHIILGEEGAKHVIVDDEVVLIEEGARKVI